MTELDKLMAERAAIDKKIRAIKESEQVMEFRFVRLFFDMPTKRELKHGVENIPSCYKLQIKVNTDFHCREISHTRWVTLGYFKTKEMALVRTDELITDLNMLKRTLSNSITRKEN